MENKTKFYEVILKCPLNEPHNECVFNPFRQMSITELIDVSQKMDSAELKNLLEHHNECISKRKRNKLAS